MKTNLFKLIGCAGLLLFCLSIQLPTRCVAGQVIAWGDNSYGQTNVPPNLNGVLALAGGFSHSLALMSNGTVVGWGDNTYSQTNAPANLTNAVAIAAGWYHNLALRSDGTVVAWGAGMTDSGSPPDFGQSIVPGDLSNVVAIAAGQYHSMALRADGTVRVWGDNSYGQTNVPIVLTNAMAIAAGSNFCLALRTDGTVLAWGDNGNQETNVPFGVKNVAAIAAGDSHCLIFTAARWVGAWGSQTHVPGALTDPAGTIISVNDGTSETIPGKPQAQDGNVVVTGGTNGPTVIDGNGGLAVWANGRVNFSNNPTVGPVSMTNYSKYTPIPDYTTQGTSNTLFDFSRFIAVADATTGGFAPSGNNHFTNLMTFIAAANAYNPTIHTGGKTAMEGVIVVDVYGGNSSGKNADPYMINLKNDGRSGDANYGINVRGTLIFNFTGFGWNPTTAKIIVDTPVNINPADLSQLVANNPATYTTGYPPIYQNPSLNPVNIDITWVTNPATGLTDFQNFTAGDTLPAFMGTIGLVDLHGPLNISGDMYTPSYMEIENFDDITPNNTQYVKGSLIMGVGIYIENIHGGALIFSGNPQPIAIAIAARGSHNLALMGDGSVFAWGSQSDVLAGLTNVTAIAAGVSHNLALSGNAPPIIRSQASLANASWSANGFSFSLPSQNGRVYSMEYCDSLSDGNWKVVSLAAGNGGVLTLIDSASPNPARFYRVRQW